MSNTDSWSWREVEAEYKSARVELTKLVNEGNGIGPQAEELILQLDTHYNQLKHRVDSIIPMNKSLTTPIPPPIDRSKLKGFLAYRAWKIEIKGRLTPSVMTKEQAWSKPVAFANSVPCTANHNGLHATRIEKWESNSYDSYGQSVSGLVDLYGKVVEHADGVMRAECARIMCMFLTVVDDNYLVMLASGVYARLHDNYPGVPIYIITDFQKKLIMYREILVNYRAV
ncbi:MAG: hypothetical protein KKH61_20580 [Gammaproteobacteria bacterium]|nr:hypothetical protein [Gammaproteobacteria bacterium]